MRKPWNASHINDPKLTAMLKEQRRTKDLEARKKIIHDIQRYAAEQVYFVYLNSIIITASWQPYVKNFGPTAVPSWMCYIYPQWVNHPLASCGVIRSKASVMA